jgi:uncharacterized membrane protein
VCRGRLARARQLIGLLRGAAGRRQHLQGQLVLVLALVFLVLVLALVFLVLALLLELVTQQFQLGLLDQERQLDS